VASWSDAVESVRLLGRALGVPIDVEADPHPPFHPGRSAALHFQGVLLGHAGELHPRVTEAFGLPPRTCAMEASLDLLIDAAPSVATAPVVSPYPAATIDVALVVAEDLPVKQVAAALRAGAGELLEALRMFDLYSGAQIGEGRKSVAFSLRLRAPDRTLTADEVAAVRDAAVAEATSRTGAALRTA
jgi:phenylalanyl-tRNA synthetase beta chain